MCWRSWRRLQSRPIDGHCPQVARPIAQRLRRRRNRQRSRMYLGGGSEGKTGARAVHFHSRSQQRQKSVGPVAADECEEQSANLLSARTIASRPICLSHGSVDQMVRFAIANGIDPIDAFRAATLNSAEAFGLADRGAIAPGRWADLMIFDDLARPTAREVFVAGKIGARLSTGRCGGGETEQSLPMDAGPNRFANPRPRPAGARDRIVARSTSHRTSLAEASIVDGFAVADPQRDLLKMAVIERHRSTGNVGLGFIAGIWPEARRDCRQRRTRSSQSGGDRSRRRFDAHRCIGRGTKWRRIGGGGGNHRTGPSAAAGGRVDERSTNRPGGGRLHCASCGRGESRRRRIADPFMAMSFMALEVIPSLKLTDLGLVDVDRFQRVDLFE